MLHEVPPQRAYRITGETDVDSPWHWTGGHRPVRTMSSALSSQEGEATASRRPLGLAPPSAPLAGLVIASGHHQFSRCFLYWCRFPFTREARIWATSTSFQVTLSASSPVVPLTNCVALV